MANITIEKIEEIKENNNLPQGWVECELEYCLEKLCNGTSKKQSKDYGGVPVSRIETISYSIIDFNKVGYIADITEEERQRYKLIKGDILFSNINSDIHLGKTAIYNSSKELLHGMNLLLIRVNQKMLLPMYLHFYFNFCRFSGQFIKIAQHAVNQSSINQTKLNNFGISLPPVTEQERIVDKIEELFSDIDAGVKNLELAKLQIKQYRQSVLKSAFEGKFYKTTLWEKSNIGNAVTKIVGGGTPSKEIAKYFEGNIPFMTVKDMKSTRPVDTQWHITEEAIKSSSTNIIPKDTIITATRVGLGKIVRVPFETTINQDLKAIFLKPKMNKDYFEHLLNHKTPDIVRISRGTTVKGITLDDFKAICIEIPSIPEQQKILEEIEKRFEVADSLEQSVIEGLEKAKQLKQSILKKAFEGKLVPQNPSDESASILLEKIKAEKTKLQTKNTAKITKIKKKDKIELDDTNIDIILESMNFIEERKQNKSNKIQNKYA